MDGTVTLSGAIDAESVSGISPGTDFSWMDGAPVTLPACLKMKRAGFEIGFRHFVGKFPTVSFR
jgi:hypothetical protein